MDEAGTQPAENAGVSQNGFVVLAKIEKPYTCGSVFRQPLVSYTSFRFGWFLFEAMPLLFSRFVCKMGVPQKLLSATRPVNVVRLSDLRAL